MKKLSQIFSKILLLILFLYCAPSFGQTITRLQITSVKSSVNTGMDYSPWLDSNLKDFVQDVWTPANQVWVDLTLPLAQHSVIASLSLYDMEGSWPDKPDTVYALNGKVKTLIAIFTGPNYQTVDSYPLKTPVEADAIVIHKFGNNIPQKVIPYGYAYASTNANADLSSLTVNSGTLKPDFYRLVVRYTETVDNTVTAIKVTPTVAVSGATVTVNGKAVTSGVLSQAVPLLVGINTVTVMVTSKDKSTTRSYALIITRNPSAVNNLFNLTISNGTLNPKFNTNSLNYAASVANNVTFLRVTPTATDVTSVIKVNGVIVASGSASQIIPLSVGNNVITTAVTAQDQKSVKNYITTVTRLALPTTTLSALAISTGKLAPTFLSTVLNYSTTLDNSVTSLQVTPRATDFAATIRVNGVTVLSGRTSASIPLATGTNTIQVVVTETGRTTQTYTISAVRGQSTNDNLASLSLSTGALSPVFNAQTLAYTASVVNPITSIKLLPTTSDATATITVNGVAVGSGKQSAAISLIPGPNVISTVVTAQDKKTIKTYVVTVVRAIPVGANLSALAISAGTLSPAFNALVLSYTAKVANSVTSINITPTSIDGSTIQVNNATVASGSQSASIPLIVGVNSIKVVLTATNLVQNTYVVSITRQPSPDASLANLTITGGTLTPAFSSTVNTYRTTVSSSLQALIVKPTTSDITATVAVNGQVVSRGASASVALASGVTNINTIVTAQDGVTQEIYALAITKPDTTSLPPDSTVTPPDTTATPPDTTGQVVKIPIDPSRFYMMNNVTGDLSGLFDGVVNSYINVGYGLLFNTFDCYYSVRQGEAIDLTAIKFYSYTGGLTTPMLVSVIDNTGTRTQIGSYIGGSVYNAWVGPYPGKTGFNLTKVVKNVKYIVLTATTTFGFPTEMEFDGYYTAPPDTTPVVKKSYPLSQYFGINAFEWNFEDPNNPLVVSTTLLTAMKSFTQFRHYMDWSKLETTQGKYTYDPVHSGGWNYDALYQAAKTNNMLVLADLKTQPAWMMATWPAGQQDSENVPVMYGKDFSDPNSYIEQARLAFQYAARYGTNTNVNSSLLSVDPSIRWTNDPPNTVKKGLGLITYFECDNERDKWWKGVNAYQNCYQYAANLSAFYDGNKNTMGPGVGVKNADPNMQVVIGGLCSADPAYIHGMVEWCKQNRGYKADGTVNLCWDVINYHFYASDGVSGGNATVGVAPEIGSTAKLAQGYLKMAHQYAYDQEVWVTESGYDLNTGSPQRAPAIGSKTSQMVEGDWILRTALLYARSGVSRVFFYEAHDDNANVSIQYSSSGLLNDDQTRRPAADYLYQANKLFGTFQFKKTLNSDPIVDNYQTSDGNNMYMLVVPDQKGRTASYSLDMNGADSAYVYNPKAGANDMTVNKVKLTGGKLTVSVTETPTFITPSGIAKPVVVLAPNSLVASSSVVDATSLNSVTLYPNPTTSNVTVAFTNKTQGALTIKISDVNSNKTYKSYSYTKSGDSFSTTIDISALPKAVYIVQVVQGDQSIIRKEIKSN